MRLDTQDLINPAATGRRPAVTALRIGMQRLFIVHGYLFAGTNIAEREEYYVSIDSPHKSIRFARMIDVMGAVAAATAINAPDAVDITDAQFCSVGTALRFGIRNSLARVFSDFATAGKMNAGKTTSAVD